MVPDMQRDIESLFDLIKEEENLMIAAAVIFVVEEGTTRYTSELYVKALKNIKCCAITISGLYVLGLPLFHFVDPPIGFLGLIIIFASLVIAVFAAILQRLLQEAIKIKSENDLTV